MTRSFVGALGLVVACGFANPVARRPDGTSANARTRIGVASASLAGDCDDLEACAVQISLVHSGSSPRRAEVVAVRVIADGVDLGPVPIADVKQWRQGAYRSFARVVWPHRSTKLSIELGPVDWSALGLDDERADIHVEIEVAIDDEPVVARSIFAVRRGPEIERVFVVT